MKKKTYDDVYNLLKENGCELLSKEYINNSSKLEVTCSCGKIFKKTLDSMNRNKRYMCNDCSDVISRKNKTISYEYVKKYIEKQKYKLITKKEDYINSDCKIKIKCDKNHTYEVTFNSFFNGGRRCPICKGINCKERLLTKYEDIVKYVESINYKLLTKKEDYIDMSKNVIVKCDKGHIINISINKLRNGRRCKHCNSIEIKKHISIGEYKIIETLNMLNISYINEYSFDDCKFKNKLKFDFYLDDINTIIEFDGQQHYNIIDYFGGYDGFVDTKIRDTVKNIYCKQNNIKLIRIPYWEIDNIETILTEKLRYDDTEVS